MPTLLLLFVVLPAVELALLIEVGSRIGTAATLALIVATGMLGAALARRQGLGVLRRLQRESAAGRLPAEPLVDGVLVLLAAALLVTPGILTDAVGFACLMPAFRDLVKRGLRRRLERAVREGRVEVHLGGVHGGDPWHVPPLREEKEVRGVGEDPDAGPRRPPTFH